MKTTGFTLIELIVVVTILAIVSAGAVGLMSGLTLKSAVTMTYATEKQLTDQLNSYVKGHDGLMPDGFDSLMRDDWAAVSAANSTTYTTDATTGQILLTTPSSMVKWFMYSGYDVSPLDGVADTGAKSLGTTITACGGGVQTLTVTQLRASDVAALKVLGITTVYDIDHATDMVDGTLTYIKRTLKAGDPVMALDPAKAFGTIPTYVTINGNDADYTGSGTKTDANYNPHYGQSNVRNLFLVFGIGSNCTIIGDRKAGLQEVPVCTTLVTTTTDKPKPRTDCYNRYLAVVKMPFNDLDRPCFAAILDSQGWNAQGAQQWYNRFPE